MSCEKISFSDLATMHPTREQLSFSIMVSRIDPLKQYFFRLWGWATTIVILVPQWKPHSKMILPSQNEKLLLSLNRRHFTSTVLPEH